MQRQEMIKALSIIKPGLATNAFQEQTDSIIFMGNRLATWNGEISVSCPFESGIAGAVRGDELYHLLNKWKEDDVSVEQKDDHLLLKCGRGRAGLKIQETILPIPDIVVDNLKLIPLPNNFLQAVNLCLFSASRDATRPDLCSINFEDGKAMSCDNFRITEVILEEVESDQTVSFLFPADIAANMLKIKNDPKVMAIDDGWMHLFDDNGVVFSFREIEVDYPDLTEFMITEGEQVKFPTDLTEALERAAVLAKTEFELDMLVSLKFTKDMLTIRGEGEVGWFEEDIKIKYDGPDLNVMIHPKFLADILGHLQNVIIGPKTLLFEGDGVKHVICRSS